MTFVGFRLRACGRSIPCALSLLIPVESLVLTNAQDSDRHVHATRDVHDFLKE